MEFVNNAQTAFNVANQVLNVIAPLIPQERDPLEGYLENLHEFSIQYESEHMCCKSKTKFKVFSEVAKLPNNIMPGGLPMPPVPIPQVDIGPKAILFARNKGVNCAESKNFEVKILSKDQLTGKDRKVPFLKVRKAPKCIFGNTGCSRIATIIDVRKGRYEELGEVRKLCGVCNYTLQIWVKDRLRYLINTVSCDCTCTCCRCGSIRFEIVQTFGEDKAVGGFTKVTIINSYFL